MIIAGTCISAVCANMTGSAMCSQSMSVTPPLLHHLASHHNLPPSPPQHTIRERKRGIRTNTHDNQEPRHKPPKVHNRAASSRARVDKIVRIGASSADPIRHRSEGVGCDDEERQVVVEEGGAEDDEEEADCEYLRRSARFVAAEVGPRYRLARLLERRVQGDIGIDAVC
ncbi:hypothetical protein MRB53_041091 [Persea americana]|nr:hypothetical protein MRB53_041091 [Persea americana]